MSGAKSLRVAVVAALFLSMVILVARPAEAHHSQGFGDITKLPGWVMVNNSGPLSGNGWFQGDDTTFPAHKGGADDYIAADMNAVFGSGTISLWLLSPVVTLTNGTELTFWTRTTLGSERPDRLQVRLSLAGSSTNVGSTPTSVGDFIAMPLSINQDLAVGGYPAGGWTEFKVTIDGLNGATNGRFGLRYFVTDAGMFGSNSNYIGIDSVSISSPCTAPPFSDVSISHPFCSEIKWMKETGISTGYPDGTYRPTDAVSRAAMSAFMARLANANLSECTSRPFTDVPITYSFCPEIKWMALNGISTGFPDGTYRPNIPVSRAAMSAFMARFANASLTSCSEPPFSDVPTEHPFCREIKWMAARGISTGFADGTYRPGIDVTRMAMSAFLFRLAHLS